MLAAIVGDRDWRRTGLVTGERPLAGRADESAAQKIVGLIECAHANGVRIVKMVGALGLQAIGDIALIGALRDAAE